MNKKLVLTIGLFLLGGISQSRGDGFIVVERPIYVPPTHFPFAPLEVTNHHVNVAIDGQVAITSIDQEFYNPNDQRLEGLLQSALKVRPDKSNRPFVVIFLTDGLPTVGTRNPEEIVAIIKKASGVRIFSFGIGSDVNTQLLDQIAVGTRAFSQYVLANEDLELKVSNFYTRIKEPALTNLKLDLGGSVHTAKMYPADLPDLFKGDQLVVAGRYSGAGDVEAKLTGNVGGREQTFTYKLHFDDRKTTDDYVPRLWATRRVGFLLDEIRIHGETAELRDETTELARKYGIVTPYTAYLIVEDEDRRRVPMADRSMQSMTTDAATRAEVAKA